MRGRVGGTRELVEMNTPPEILLQLFLSMFSVVATAVIGIWVHRITRRADAASKEEEKRKEEAEKAELLRKEEYDALKDGLTALLRDSIIQADVRLTEQGFATVHQKDSLQMMYESYHRLGGNGIVTQSFNHIKSIPIMTEEGAVK